VNDQGISAAARLLPSGARFFKCALQVNPHHYASTFRGQASGGDPFAHACAIVDRAAEVGISVLAITDHNDVSGVAAFREAAEGRGVTVLPGFELTTSEGIQVLCIYAPAATEEQLGRYLGELGILGTEPSTTLSEKSFEEVLEKVREQGGITIAAHATQNKGLFRALQGQARVKAWRNENLLAAQIPGSIAALPDEFRQIVENRNPDYSREHAAGERQAVAVVNAKDVVTPDDLAKESATCWIKMSGITIEGLRQAFLDPDSRIRLNSAPEPEEHAELVTLCWEGGFLDGAAIHFNQNLNVLIGGRGAGKSTVVESLRYVLAQEPLGDDVRNAHLGLVRHVLQSGTKLSLRVRAHRPVEREYLIERTVPNPPVVRDESGQILDIRPADVLPDIEIYGQHEISELTRSPEKLTALLDRFVDKDESLIQRKASVRRGLKQAGRSLLDITSELDGIDEVMSALPALEDTLRSYQEAGLEDRLSEQSVLVREERVLESLSDRIAVFRDSLGDLQREVPIDLDFLSEDALAELPGKEILGKARDVLDDLNRSLDRAASNIEEALQRADEGIANVRGRWNQRKRVVDADYHAILRDLQKSAVDGEEFIRLRREIEFLRPLTERRTLLLQLRSEHADRRRNLLAEWEELKAQQFRFLRTAADEVNRRLRQRVQVAVVAAGNREPLLDALKENVGGRLSEALNILRDYPDLSLPEFVERCRQGPDAIRKTYAISPAQAERLASATPETLLQLEELELQPTTTIQLNTAAPGEPPSWQALGELSTGQKATAVLLLLLLESDSPLIIDQPEDDLDNRFITDGVVPRMREEKRRRQFVFSTHNANIPVLGDAELILGLSPSGEAESGHAEIKTEHMGSIDDSAVRGLVEDILEGGKEAFETRRLKYGF